MRQFYQMFKIRDTLRHELTWSHYRRLISVENEQTRIWYMNEAEDLFEFHFTLGLLIRNNWLYERNEEELESLSKAFGVDIPYFAADDLSSEILEAYQKHLKRTIK